MNAKLMKCLAGAENRYPHLLEAKYPRIAEKIAELWNSPKKSTDYFTDLLIDKRGGRQGFPPDIAREIFLLSVYYDNARANENTGGDVWGAEERDAQKKLEGLGLKLVPAHMLKAAEYSDPSRVLLFLQAGMDVNARDEREWTPLMVAAFNGNEAVAKLLILHGADRNARDRAGYTPLHWAALNGFQEVVRILIDKGVECNAQSSFGLTALLQAASKGHSTVITLLLGAGADPNIASSDGLTPLHKAVANGHADTVALLVRAGAAVLAASKQGMTPLSIAKTRAHGQILEMLRHGLKSTGGGSTNA
jgi:ankyrin repeat protein